MICRRRAKETLYVSHRDQRLTILAPDGKSIPATLHAAIFSEIISMAAMLSTPRWRDLTHGTRPERLEQLCAEINRRIRYRYEPTGTSDGEQVTGLADRAAAHTDLANSLIKRSARQSTEPRGTA